MPASPEGDLPAPAPLFGPDNLLSAAAIEQRNWRLERANGDVIARRLILHPGGGMGLHRHRNQWRWSVESGLLLFADWHARLSTVFDRLDRSDDGRAVFSGACRYDEQPHRLFEIEPIAFLHPDGGGIRLLGESRRRRRNLVVLRANEDSLHTTWPANVDGIERSWDLCISFYGKAENFPPPDFAEYHVLQNEDRKFTALHKLMHRNSPLWDYDYVMFPDDDLMMSWMDLNNAFEIVREHRLELAQPALTHDGFCGQPITLQQPDTLLRFTNYVECMMPIFSIEALRLCAPTFAHATVGWGLDCIWPAMIGSTSNRVAILDLVAVRHTRPIGFSYAGLDAHGEMMALQTRFGVTHRLIEYGKLILA